MRCKSCNKIMQDYEIMSKNPKSGIHEEMCRSCINLSYGNSPGPEVAIIMDVPLIDSLPHGPRSMDD